MIALFKASSLKSPVEPAHLYISSVVREVEKCGIYPRQNVYLDRTLLSLLDKIVSVSEAVIVLVKAGFASEAYGLSRTAVEAFFSLRYIENEDSEVRAKRFNEYFAKDRENLVKIVASHHPHLNDDFPDDMEQMKRIASGFKSPGQWLPPGQSMKTLAKMPSSWAVDEKGQPETWIYSYEVIYKYTSHEVHATSVALYAKLYSFREYNQHPPVFRFSEPTREADGDLAIFNCCNHLQGAVEIVFHAFDIMVPIDIRKSFNNFQIETGLPAAYPDLA